MACTKLDITSKDEILYVFPVVSLLLLQVTAGCIRHQEVLNIIRDSNIDANLFPSQTSSKQEGHEITGTIVCGKYSNN